MICCCPASGLGVDDAGLHLISLEYIHQSREALEQTGGEEEGKRRACLLTLQTSIPH